MTGIWLIIEVSFLKSCINVMEVELEISVLTSAEIVICLSYSYNKLKLNKMKTKVSHCIHKWTKTTGKVSFQIVTRQANSEWHSQELLPGREAVGAVCWLEHFHSNFDELPGTESVLVWERDTYQAVVLLHITCILTVTKNLY